ncbi:hypothetical protein [Microvirga terricola]|uniref:Lipoprotein n=1 Tax=Microvirga terricola TaxID=2719797 RepID=A0ABX0V9X1_9HYPH|nr:hypothetical protein [Microvirga terricola]NIX75815.1 hypothetical protein [Microvirga terricola]
MAISLGLAACVGDGGATGTALAIGTSLDRPVGNGGPAGHSGHRRSRLGGEQCGCRYRIGA